MQKHHSLVATPLLGPDLQTLHVGLVVDGQSLIEWMRQGETPYARREGVEALAGNYANPVLTLRLLQLLAGDAGEGVILDCPCGQPGCWPLLMDVRVQARSVVWDRFRQSRRIGTWSLQGLGPLRFSRSAYFLEVDRLRAALKPARDRSAQLRGACAL